MTFYLTHQEDDAGPESYHTQRVEFTVADDADISELCDSFEHFLKANGYEFDGHIGIIPKKEWFNSWKPEDDATSGHYRVKFNWNTDLG
jgi:hypothetical protein